MGEIPTGYVSGGDGDRLGGALPHTAEKIGAWEKSADREYREREFAAMQPPTTEIEHPWGVEQRAESAKKEAERQAKIVAGKLVVHQNGNGYTEVLPPRW